MERGVLTFLLKTLEDDQGLEKNIPFVLAACSEHSLLTLHEGVDQDAVEQLVSKATRLLKGDSSKERWAGACLVRCVIEHADIALVSSNLPIWFGTLLHYSKTAEYCTSCATKNAFEALIQRLPESAELKRMFTTTYLSQMMGMLLQASAARPLEQLRRLRKCMRAMETSIRSYATKIQVICVSALREGDSRVQRAAMQTLALLPTISQGTETWSDLATRCIGSMHGVLNVAFGGMYEADATKFETEPSFNIHLGDGAVLPSLVAVRFGALCRGLQCLLSGSYTTPVPVPISAILEVVIRVLNVDSGLASTQKKSKRDHLSGESLLVLLPALHMDALAVLGTLSRAARTHVLPHGQPIARLLLRALGERRAASSHSNHPRYHDVVYATIAAHVRALRGAVPRSMVASTVRFALVDMGTASARELTNELVVETKPQPLKKKHRKLHTPVSLQDRSAPVSPLLGSVCAVLRAVLLCCGAELDALLRKSIDDALLKQFRDHRGADVSMLQATLLASITSAQGERSATIPLAVRAFSHHTYAHPEGRAACEGLLHPRVAPVVSVSQALQRASMRAAGKRAEGMVYFEEERDTSKLSMVKKGVVAAEEEERMRRVALEQQIRARATVLPHLPGEVIGQELKVRTSPTHPRAAVGGWGRSDGSSHMSEVPRTSATQTHAKAPAQDPAAAAPLPAPAPAPAPAQSVQGWSARKGAGKRTATDAFGGEEEETPRSHVRAPEHVLEEEMAQAPEVEAQPAPSAEPEQASADWEQDDGDDDNDSLPDIVDHPPTP